MRHRFTMLATAIALGVSQSAAAADCQDGHICAGNPEGVLTAMKSLGVEAELVKDGAGDPQIDVTSAGYDYTILFYECVENIDCKSLTFITVFNDDGNNTATLANQWNKTRRFSHMAVNDDMTLGLTYDVTTQGGLNQANFAGIVDRWQTNLADLNAFFRSELPQAFEAMEEAVGEDAVTPEG